MAHGDEWEGKWRGNWRMEWVASSLHTTLEHGVSSITTPDAHTSAASSRLNWRPCPFKWIRPFRRKTKSGFCACASTFQTQSTTSLLQQRTLVKHAVYGAMITTGCAKSRLENFLWGKQSYVNADAYGPPYHLKYTHFWTYKLPHKIWVADATTLSGGWVSNYPRLSWNLKFFQRLAMPPLPI